MIQKGQAFRSCSLYYHALAILLAMFALPVNDGVSTSTD